VYSFSTSLRKAIDILTSLEEHLGKVWGLKIKESSRACMVCKGNPDRPLDPDLWPLCTSTIVLGHIVQNDEGIKQKTEQHGKSNVALPLEKQRK